MTTPKMDADSASAAGRKHLAALCGRGGLFSFEPVTVVFHDDRGIWALTCSFWCLGSTGDTTKPRTRRLLIDDASGKVVGSDEVIEA